MSYCGAPMELSTYTLDERATGAIVGSKDAGPLT